MISTAFDGENCVLNAPPGVDCDTVAPLSVCRGLTSSGFPAVLSCWKPTKDELEEIQRTGRVWLLVMGETMPPVMVCGYAPETLQQPG